MSDQAGYLRLMSKQFTHNSKEHLLSGHVRDYSIYTFSHFVKNYLPIKQRHVQQNFCHLFNIWHLNESKKSQYEYILVCIQSAKETASVLFREIFCRYGAPRVLFSDRGRNFMSKLINALCECLKSHSITPQHIIPTQMVWLRDRTVQ